MNIVVNDIEVLKKASGGNVIKPTNIIKNFPTNTPHIAGSNGSMSKPQPQPNLPIRPGPVINGLERI